VEFANEHDALISIHAGRKENGIDKNCKYSPKKFELNKIYSMFS